MSHDVSPGSRVRYRVLALAVLLVEITYLDRVCLSLTTMRNCLKDSGRTSKCLSSRGQAK
ncbi:MAG: hypothetical protein ABIU20_05415 [Blastocatellia bacterium]